MPRQHNRHPCCCIGVQGCAVHVQPKAFLGKIRVNLDFVACENFSGN